MLWLVGGLDNSGGAGLIRDAITAGHLLPHHAVHAIASALTFQTGCAPARAQATDGARFAVALAAAPRPSVIKLGLLPDQLVETWQRERPHVPAIVDPVMRASDGGDLGASVQAVLARSAGVALLTPNFEEACALARARSIQTPDLEDAELSLERAQSKAHEFGAQLCRELGVFALLIKSVPLATRHQVNDLLISHERVQWLSRERMRGPSPRGTGCALASYIAARLTLEPAELLDACAKHCERLAQGERHLADPELVTRLESVVRAGIHWLDQARTRTHAGPDGRPHLLR